jgi:hypothetical protein
MSFNGKSERIWDKKHQKWLDVVRVNPSPKRPRPNKTDRLFGCPVWWLKLVLPLVHTKQQLIVAVYLWRRYVLCGRRDTFDMPNGELAAWGVGRRTKYRTIVQLESGGVIKTKRQGRKALTVTILVKTQGEQDAH